MTPKTIKGLTRKWIRTDKVTWEFGFFPEWAFRDGWSMLVDRLIETLLMLGWDGHLCQAKEKFGGLRFYVTRYNGEHSEAMMNIVSLAEHASYSICEVCSDMGTVRGLPWIQTLCDRHFEEAKKPRKFR